MRRRIYGSNCQGLKPITILNWRQESKNYWILLKTNRQVVQDYAKIKFDLNIYWDPPNLYYYLVLSMLLSCDACLLFDNKLITIAC